MAEAQSVVSEECLLELLQFFSRGSYKAKSVDRRNEIIHKMCIHLVARDYEVEVIDNKAGQLCGHYPSELLVIEGHKVSSTHPSGRRVNNAAQLRGLVTAARFARCRSRFVMPVILFEDKNICRSATLSTMAEMYGRSGMDWIFTGGETSGGSPLPSPHQPSPPPHAPATTPTSGEEAELMTRVRGQDVQLLKAVGVRLICDLMVEKKKSKYGLSVASSEKVDKWARYCDFWIASMPYPGCEFFKEYRDNDYDPEGLQFDWSQSMIDADLYIPTPLHQLTQVQFNAYQEWDLVEITRSYLKLFLRYIQHYDGSLLVHCISGWDRTPLFISLLRLSLWADGKVHESLSCKEMLYFTIAYDWFTFGHPFKERLDKGEEIMYFCFDALKYITSDAFSVNSMQRLPHSPSRYRANGFISSSQQGDTPSSPHSQGHTHSSQDHTPCSHVGRTHNSRDHTPSSHAGHTPCSQDHTPNGGTPPPMGSVTGDSWLSGERTLRGISPSARFSPNSCQRSSQKCPSGRSSSCSPSFPSNRDTYSLSPAAERFTPPPHHTPHPHSLHPHPPHSHPSHSDHHESFSGREEKLLAVRTLFQQLYKVAVPESQHLSQSQGPVAFATGLLSRLASFASASGNTNI